MRGLLVFVFSASLLACSTQEGSDAEDFASVAAAQALKNATAVEFFSAGTFAPLADYDDSAATGSALVTRYADGSSAVSVKVSGLEPDTSYPAHLHVLPCAYNGGGHYKIDPTVAGTDPNNEVWPAFTTDDAGNGLGDLVVDHRVRASALSVVVHDPNNGNAKMLCADLAEPHRVPGRTAGKFEPFASAEDIDQSISGFAVLVRGRDNTQVQVRVRGLDPDTEYRSHVHAEPCDVNNAGGHYKLDPTVAGTEAANEIWPTVAPNANGAARDRVVTEGHVARADAQSVVIHRVTDSGAPKVACANLSWFRQSSLTTSGTALVFDAAIDRGFTDLQAMGLMTRALDDSTRARVRVRGLAPNTTYGSHVHNQPCIHGSGGGHYKKDTSVAGAVEENEVWFSLATDEEGNATDRTRTEGILRADAMSVVVHDTDGIRLLCIDLI